MTKSKPSLDPTVTYRVANPRSIPAGRWILRARVNGQRRDFFEGDPIAPGDAASATGWATWLASGYVVATEEVPVG